MARKTYRERLYASAIGNEVLRGLRKKLRMGSSACFGQCLTVPVLEQIVRQDIAAKAKITIGREEEFKRRYLERQATLTGAITLRSGKS